MTTQELPSRYSVPASLLDKTSKLVGSLQHVPPQVVSAIQASLWFAKVGGLRLWEERRSVEGHCDDEVGVHRVLMSSVIAEGEELVGFIKHHGLPGGFSEFKLADIEATLETLNIAFRCEYGNHNPPQLNEAIDGLFSGA